MNRYLPITYIYAERDPGLQGKPYCGGGGGAGWCL